MRIAPGEVHVWKVRLDAAGGGQASGRAVRRILYHERESLAL